MRQPEVIALYKLPGAVRRWTVSGGEIIDTW